MAETLLALEISEQKVRYIFLEKKGNILAPQGTGVSKIQTGSPVPGVLAKFIKETISTRNIKVSRVFITINRRDTVIHQLNLPKVSKSDLMIIVPGEIEKIPSFTDRDFDYIYRNYELPNNKSKVIFAAVADDLLKYVLKEVQQTRLPCQELEISPLNFVGLLAGKEFTEGIQALIVLNDNTTYLIVFRNKQIQYFYTTNTGKENLFPALSNQSLDAVACSSWAEELKRVLKSYALENKQELIQRTWLLWDRESSPSLSEYLNSALKLNVAPLTADKMPGLRKESSETLNPIYLLACVPAIYSASKIKPQYPLSHFFRNAHTKKHLRGTLITALIFMALVGAILGKAIYQFYQIEHKARQSTKAVQAKTVELENQSKDLFKIRDEYLAVRNQLLAQATYVKLLNRMSWSEVLSVVASELPEELSLKSFKVNESGLASFTGEAFRIESVSELLRKVETSAILANGKFSYLTEQEVEKQKIFSFGILANIQIGEEHE